MLLLDLCYWTFVWVEQCSICYLGFMSYVFETLGNALYSSYYSIGIRGRTGSFANETLINTEHSLTFLVSDG